MLKSKTSCARGPYYAGSNNVPDMHGLEARPPGPARVVDPQDTHLFPHLRHVCPPPQSEQKAATRITNGYSSKARSLPGLWSRTAVPCYAWESHHMSTTRAHSFLTLLMGLI